MRKMDGNSNAADYIKMILSDPTREENKAMAEVADYINKMMLERDPTHENIVSTVNLDCKLDLQDIASRLEMLYDPESFDALVMRIWDPRTTAIISASGKVVCTGAKTKRDAEFTAIQVALTLISTMGYPAEILHDFKIEGVYTGTTKLKQITNFSPKDEITSSDISSIGKLTLEKLATQLNSRNAADFTKWILSEQDPTPEMARLADFIRKQRIQHDPTRENLVLTVNLDCKLDLQAIASKLHWILYDPESFDALIMRFREPRTTALISASGKVVCTGAKTVHDAKVTACKVASTLSRTMGYPIEFLHELKIEGVSTGTKKLLVEASILTKGEKLHDKWRNKTVFCGLKNKHGNWWVSRSGKFKLFSVLEDTISLLSSLACDYSCKSLDDKFGSCGDSENVNKSLGWMLLKAYG